MNRMYSLSWWLCRDDHTINISVAIIIISSSIIAIIIIITTILV